MEHKGVYVMRIASMLSGMHPQTLRKYERVGLLSPSRSGMLRMYSDDDIALLKMIKYLVEELGLNLAGVELALNLRSRLLEMEQELMFLAADSQFRRRLAKAIDEMLHLIEPM
ncbi:MAG: MerR family transcriptional regulator [Dehalococcoidia bacterium]